MAVISRQLSVSSFCRARCLKGIAPLRMVRFDSMAQRRETPETTRGHSRPTIPLSVLLALVLAGCATGPRIVEVTGTKHIETIGVADKNLFLTDQASRITFQADLLPVTERGEDFYVRWTGTNVDLVKFEYRQVNVPNTVKEQFYVPSSMPGRAGPPGQPTDVSTHQPGPRDPRWHLFAVRGDDYATGGFVSAWRVSLWSGGTNGTFLAERVSAVW